MKDGFPPEHVPFELLRALVAVVEHHSVTKAARALGLTQPAVSAQIRRLELLVGAELFNKSGGGLRLTGRGEAVVRHARRILVLNDQILAEAGATAVSQLLRVGLASVYAATMLGSLVTACVADNAAPVQFRCDVSYELAHNLSHGYLDLAILLGRPHAGLTPAAQWTEPLSWVGAEWLTLGPDGPVPLIGWADGVADDVAVTAFEQVGRGHRVSVKATDWSARFAALHSGLGVLPLPTRLIADGLRDMSGDGLPALPPLPAGIFMREGLEVGDAGAVMERISAVMRPTAHG